MTAASALCSCMHAWKFVHVQTPIMSPLQQLEYDRLCPGMGLYKLEFRSADLQLDKVVISIQYLQAIF